MNPREARETGDALASLILSVYAGDRITFPEDPFREAYLRERNSEIRKRFDGKNAPVLAHEYGLTRAMIFHIVKSEG